MPAGGWALVGVTVGDVSSSATAIGTGGVAVDVDGCGPDGCTLRGEGGECAAGEAVTILVSSSSGIDSSSCDVGGFSWFSLKLSYASLSSFTTGSHTSTCRIIKPKTSLMCHKALWYPTVTCEFS